MAACIRNGLVIQSWRRAVPLAVVMLGVVMLAGAVHHVCAIQQTAGSDSQHSAIQQVCVVEDLRINEASGLASYGYDPTLFWMHNDSGDSARLFLVDRSGRTRCVADLENIPAFDWEDMCSFQIDHQNWLLIGDIGDNARRRGSSQTPGANPTCRLLLVAEPVIDSSQQSLQLPVHAIIDFVYEDGVRDCESLAVDTSTREILLICKSLPHTCGLYTLPLNLQGGHTVTTARRVASPGIPFATGMDVSRDNRRMVITSPVNAVLIERMADESWAAAFQRPGRTLQMPPRKQGETICFNHSGNAVLVNSEGTRQPLWQIALDPPSLD